ncbi:MAG: phosphohydrolase [Bacillus subtilis]|nr:phosphohydrolase [Bacillus subtilis]
MLHDVDDPKLVVSVDQSKSRAQAFLQSEGVDEALIRHVIDILRTMSYSAYLNGARVATIEGEIVQDADRLDAIGAIGIARAFAYGGSKRRPIYLGDNDDESSIAHFYQKLVKLVPLINLRKAKRIARKRMRLMKRFLRAFHKDFAVGLPKVAQ